MLLYPTISNYWNSFHQTQLVQEYSQEMSMMDAEEYERLLDEARRYNAQIAEKGIDWRFSDEKRAVYERTLNPTWRPPWATWNSHPCLSAGLAPIACSRGTEDSCRS